MRRGGGSERRLIRDAQAPRTVSVAWRVCGALCGVYGVAPEAGAGGDGRVRVLVVGDYLLMRCARQVWRRKVHHGQLPRVRSHVCAVCTFAPNLTRCTARLAMAHRAPSWHPSGV